MRKIVIITMILTFIFAMAGCTAHSEPAKNAVVSSSSNVVFDIPQAEYAYSLIESEMNLNGNN